MCPEQGEGIPEAARTIPPIAVSFQPRTRSRWLDWVIPALCALIYAAFCFWFVAEAWGLRGMPKPAWFKTAAIFAHPGVFFPVPLVGPIVVGAAGGLVIVGVFRWLSTVTRGGE